MDPAVAKKALRLFTYGLYVVTSAAGEETAAMTANWVGQVSFEPRMVSLSAEAEAHTLAVIRRSGVFAINVLGSDRREMAAQFARPSSKAGNKLEGHDYVPGSTGCPLLAEALASIECRVVQENPVGDHVLLVGQVVDARVNTDGEPLTHTAAGFRYSG